MKAAKSNTKAKATGQGKDQDRKAHAPAPGGEPQPNNAAQQLAEAGSDDGFLPDKLGSALDEDGGFFGDERDNTDSAFVKLSEEGETFTGQFLRLIEPNAKDGIRVKYAGLLFAEYPSGTLRILQHNHSIVEKIAEKERQDAQFWNLHAVRITLVETVKRKDGTSFKAFHYAYKRLPSTFKPEGEQRLADIFAA